MTNRPPLNPPYWMKRRRPNKIRAKQCSICGSFDGCKPIGGVLGNSKHLTANDWRLIYEFMKYVQLPFLHGIEARAIERARYANGANN
jgi:hypothetical protein